MNQAKEREPCELMAEVSHLAESAGREILAIYERGFEVETKADDSPLTEADLAAHHCILAGLQSLTPELPVLSEESRALPYATRRSWDRYWLVDPLDGTKEFIKRNGEFTVNIALIQMTPEGGVPVLGVVHVPVQRRSYLGCHVGGAWRQIDGGTLESIQVRAQAPDIPAVVGSRSHRGESLDRFLTNLGEHEMLSMGSSLKFCLVAEGSADIYPRLGPTSEWDTAAAQAVVEAAGGRVTGLDLQPLRYNTKDSLLNPHFLVLGGDRRDWSKYL